MGAQRRDAFILQRKALTKANNCKLNGLADGITHILQLRTVHGQAAAAAARTTSKQANRRN